MMKPATPLCSRQRNRKKPTRQRQIRKRPIRQRTIPPKKDASKAEDAKKDSTKQENVKQDPPKQETPEQEEPKQEEPKQEEPKQEEPKKEEHKQIIDPSTGKDKYLTDPVPEGKPVPVESEDTTVDTSKKHTCTFSISCSTILNNMDLCEESKQGIVPADGTILSTTTVTFSEGESVFDVLQRVCRDNGIHMEYSWTPMYNSAYVEGIANLYEFDVGRDVQGQRLVPQLWLLPLSVEGWRYGLLGLHLRPGLRRGRRLCRRRITASVSTVRRKRSLGCSKRSARCRRPLGRQLHLFRFHSIINRHHRLTRGDTALPLGNMLVPHQIL